MNKRKIIFIFLLLLGYLYVIYLQQFSGISIIYSTDEVIERMVVFTNEEITKDSYTDIAGLPSGMNQELQVEFKGELETLRLNPRTEGGQLSVEGIKYTAKSGKLIFHVTKEQMKSLFDSSYVVDGNIVHGGDRDIVYTWNQKSEDVLPQWIIGNSNCWEQIQGEANRAYVLHLVAALMTYTLIVGLGIFIYSKRAFFIKYKHYIKRIVPGLLIVTVAYGWATRTLSGYMICLGFACIVVVFFVNWGILKEVKLSLKEYCGLFCVGALAIYLPLLFSYYYFGDEWIVFTGEMTKSSFGGVITFGRIFQSIFINLFGFITPNSIGLLRFFMCFQMFVFSSYIYKKLYGFNGSKIISFSITMLLCCSSAAVDCLAYGAIVSYVMSFGMVVFSFIMFEKAIEGSKNKVNSIALLVSSVIFIVLACHAYQIGLTVIFLVMSIELWYTNEVKSVIGKYIRYGVVFILGVVIYYVTLSAMSKATGSTAALSRGGAIGLADMPAKIEWFLSEVLVSSTERVVAVFSGPLLFENNNYWVGVVWKNLIINKDIVLWAIGIFIVVGILVSSYQKRSVLRTIILILLIPCAYSVMIVLKENSYHTYYAYALISILLFYFTVIVLQIVKSMSIQRNWEMIFAVAMASICILQSMYYVKSAWCSQEMVVDYMEASIISQEQKEKRIHLYGEKFWGGHPIYGYRAAEIILRNMERNPEEYLITLSENAESCKIVSKKQYSELESKEMIDKKIFEQYYIYDESYAYYRIIENTLSQEEIKQMCRNNGLLPNEEAIIIDMNWVATLN